MNKRPLQIKIEGWKNFQKSLADRNNWRGRLVMKQNPRMVISILSALYVTQRSHQNFLFRTYLDLIEDIAENVDRTRDRIAQQTTGISVIDRKERTCGVYCALTFSVLITHSRNLMCTFLLLGYWIVILALLVAIVIVASIPKQ